jgi:antitoxin VapB
MTTTKLFLNNRTQAVRLPKDVAFPDDVTEVEITVEGDARVIRPVKVDLSWESFFELRDRLRRENPESEFPDRDQPEPQERVWPD